MSNFASKGNHPISEDRMFPLNTRYVIPSMASTHSLQFPLLSSLHHPANPFPNMPPMLLKSRESFLLNSQPDHLRPLSIIAPPSGSCIQSCSSSSLGSLLIPKELNNNSNQEKSGSETPSSAFSSLSNPSSSNEGSEASTSPNRVIVRSSAPKKRKEMVKDESYWEKRKKNNDAAKRSRDQRRIKEDKVATRAKSLERENAMLRVELERLRAETRILNRILHDPFAQSSDQPIAKLSFMPASTSTTNQMQFPGTNSVITCRDTVLVHASVL